MKKLLLISLILGASVTASANSKFQNQFKQVEQMTDSCGEANYGDSLTCYNEVIAKHAQLAETIKGHSPENPKFLHGIKPFRIYHRLTIYAIRLAKFRPVCKVQQV